MITTCNLIFYIVEQSCWCHKLNDVVVFDQTFYRCFVVFLFLIRVQDLSKIVYSYLLP